MADTLSISTQHLAAFLAVPLDLAASLLPKLDGFILEYGFSRSQSPSRFSGFKKRATKDFGRVVMLANSKAFEDEIIRKELQKERDKMAREAEEEAARQLRANDKSRKEMREWWIAKWEAKKRSEGWGGYEKCWVIRSSNEAVTTVKEEVISGEGILVGAAPLVSGSIKPFVIDLPTVSRIHAHVYGKDVIKGYKKYAREYFVVDLGSTNGTYLNRSRLRPRTEVKLSNGDILKFGDERAVFVVEKQI